jgi:hypothetical protein
VLRPCFGKTQVSFANLGHPAPTSQNSDVGHPAGSFRLGFVWKMESMDLWRKGTDDSGLLSSHGFFPFVPQGQNDGLGRVCVPALTTLGRGTVLRAHAMERPRLASRTWGTRHPSYCYRRQGVPMEQPAVRKPQVLRLRCAPLRMTIFEGGFSPRVNSRLVHPVYSFAWNKLQRVS